VTLEAATVLHFLLGEITPDGVVSGVRGRGFDPEEENSSPGIFK